MKKVICLLLAVILMISLASCGKRSTPDMPDEDSYGATVLKLNDIDSFQAADYPIRSRLDGWKLTLDQIKYAVSLWEEKYGSVTKLARAAVEGRLPALSDGNMIRQLTSGEYFIIALNSGS